MVARDTIAAAASPPGRAARALLRVSGREAFAVVERVLDRRVPGARGPLRARVGVPALREAGDGDEVGDGVGGADEGRVWVPVLLMVMVGPASYTGEDTVEVLLPGNPHVVLRVMQALFAAGARPAEPGEFTARAHFSGRLTLEQAEGVMHLIAAERDEQLDAARELLSGAAGGRAREWTEELAGLLALVEAGIDFTDQEDVVPIGRGALRARLVALHAAVAGVLGPEGAAEPARERPRVVLVGRPNAGKSTLFNALLGRERAVVSEHAGTTRDVLEEDLEVGEGAEGPRRVVLVDVAGVDDVRADETGGEVGVGGALDAAAQGLARRAAAAADAVLWCDPTGRFDEDARVHRGATPTLRVRTKADQPLGAGAEGIAVCALDGTNLGTVRRWIADVALGGSAGPAMVARHRRELSAAAAALAEAIESVGAGGAGDGGALADADLTAAAMRGALDHLGQLSGRVTADDVIGRIFAAFCVGK